MNNILNIIKSDSFKKMIKFGITGVINTLVDFFVFTLLNQFLFVDKYIAQVLGYSAGMLNSYIINRSWTFKTSEGFLSLQLVKFIVTNLLMLGLSLSLIWLFADVIGFHTMIAKVFATIVTMVVNFIISKLWVFIDKKGENNG